MKRAVVVLAAMLSFVGALAAQQTPQRDAPAALAAGTGVIRGVVVSDDAEHRPIRRARVVLGGVPGGRATTTDEGGAFVFSGLPVGSYTLAASKPAYIAISYGAKQPGRTGTGITLADKQVVDVSIALPLGGVIAGTVRDGRGRPLAGVDVGLVALPLPGAQRPSFSTSPVTTDDRGEYRLFGIPPGQYYVAAVGQSFTTSGATGRRTVEETDAVMAQLQTRAADPIVSAPGAPPRKLDVPAPSSASFAPIFFPGTARPDGATVITVTKGGTYAGTDFALTPVRTAVIDGTVQGPVTNLDRVELGLVIAGPQFPGFNSSRPILTQAPDVRGRFRYENMPPGHYTILARAVAGEGDASMKDQYAGGGFIVGATGGGRGGGAAGNGQEFVVGIADVDIDGPGPSSVSITLQPSATASGRIVIDKAATPMTIDPSQVRLYFMTVELATVYVSNNTAVGNIFAARPSDAVMSADGAWVARNMAPQPYRVGVTLPPSMKDWWLRAAMLDGRDLLDGPIDVQSGQSLNGIEILLTDRHSELSGTLTTTDGKAATDYFIVICPTDPKLWTANSRRVKSLRPTTDGKFSVKDLPAGEYSIVALADYLPGEANDPAWLATVAPQGAKITIADGAKTVQDLRVGGGG